MVIIRVGIEELLTPPILMTLAGSALMSTRERGKSGLMKTLGLSGFRRDARCVRRNPKLGNVHPASPRGARLPREPGRACRQGRRYSHVVLTVVQVKPFDRCAQEHAFVVAARLPAIGPCFQTGHWLGHVGPGRCVRQLVGQFRWRWKDLCTDDIQSNTGKQTESTRGVRGF
jgi:hypothetical protein